MNMVFEMILYYFNPKNINVKKNKILRPTQII